MTKVNSNSRYLLAVFFLTIFYSNIIYAEITSFPTTISQQDVPNAIRIIANKLNRQIDFDDYKTDNTTNCEALQTAINQNPGETINLPPRRLEMGTTTHSCQITVNTGVRLIGKTWVTNPNNKPIGTQFLMQNTDQPLFYINGINARGFSAENFSVTQIHPAPMANWKPTVYQPVFYIKDVGGEILIKNVLALGVYDFIKTYNAGRLNTDVKGQAFNHFFDADQEFDSNHYKAHIWPYWSTNSGVLKYQQAHSIGLYSGRNDTPTIDIFCFACYAGVQIVNSTIGNGSTSKLDGAVRADGATYGLLINGNNVTADMTLLSVQNEVVPQGTGKPVVGGRAIKITGNDNVLNIATLRADRNDTSAIEFDQTASQNTVNIASVYASFVNQNNNSDLIKNAGIRNTVNLAQLPEIRNSNNAGCGATCMIPLAQNSINNQANSLHGYAASPNTSPTLASIGTDTNIDINLTPKGTGSVNINGQGQLAINGIAPAIQTDKEWLNIYGGSKGVAITNGHNSGLLVTDKQLWSPSKGQYSLGLPNYHWANIYSNNFTLNNLLVSASQPTILNGFGKNASVINANGTAAFRINVGIDNISSKGIIGLPAANAGWNCFAQDITTTANTWQTKQTADSKTSVTLVNYSNSIPVSWKANDIIAVSCFAY